MQREGKGRRGTQELIETGVIGVKGESKNKIRVKMKSKVRGDQRLEESNSNRSEKS